MKLWIVMFLVMLLIIVGGSFLEQSILKTTNHFSHSLDSIKESVRNDQWSEAMQQRDGVDQQWSKQKDVWDPFIHNHDLDLVTSHLARLQVFIETHEKALALAEIETIQTQLTQLREQEILTLQNIL